MRKTKRIIAVVLALLLLFVTVVPLQSDNRSAAATTGVIELGRTDVYFRQTPGGAVVKDAAGNEITLNGGHQLTILDTSNTSWTKVSLVYDGVTYTGYVASQFVTINSTPATPEPSVPSDDAEFEAYLTVQGFPESYKNALRTLHTSHPTWKFVAVHTNIEWNTLLANEFNKQGQIKNLVWTSSSSPNYNWRSTSVGYDWAIDKWYPYDGTNWFAASDALVTYYLDPRTYLSEPFVFVFESLSYQSGVHNITGVEAILAGTFMSNCVAPGDTQGRTYGQLVMLAAESSGVSPYHLASRMKQEMGSSSNTCATGTFPGYEGYYNLFNIGATDTAGGNAAAKGMAYAKEKGWNSVELAIKGGAEFLGKSYINVGQDTLYTQKFNVTNTGNLFSHQYMTNVQAPSTECQGVYNAYKTNNLLESSMVFEIPVYLNMPETASVKPPNSGNPNNWLKTLSISGYTLTPTFGVNSTSNYSLIVPLNVSSLTISATTVNSSARITGGVGTVNLAEGTNYININVTAQNGSVRTYKLTVIRGSASAGSTVIGGQARGDLNGDGKISTIDIVMIQRIIVGIDALNDINIVIGDINGDGKVSTIDIVYVQRHIVGLELIQ